MFKKITFQNKIIQIVNDKYSNWEEKSYVTRELISNEERGKEFFIDLIKNNKNIKIRKGCASILGYMHFPDVASEILPQILLDKDWTVRYALSNSCAKNLGKDSVEKLESIYQNLQKDKILDQQYGLKKVFAEGLGSMGFDNAIPKLSTLLDEIGSNRDQKSIELIIQILYSLGETGDRSTINLLLRYSAENIYTNQNIRLSASHAIDKIAKRLGFVSKKDLIEELNKE